MNLKILAACLAGTLLLSGCAGHRHPFYGHGRAPTGLQVSFIVQSPPPPRRVVIPPRPIAHAIWIDGYWNWTGIRFVWVDGFWERNPPRGKTWEKHRWIHTDRGWYQKPGRWK
jgi:hypothetical protein